MGCSGASIGSDAGPRLGQGRYWLRLPGSVELVHFGGLPGLGVRSGRQHERGITHRSSGFELAVE